MTESVPQKQVAPKKQKREKKEKKPASQKKEGPSTLDVIKECIRSKKDRKGTSRQTILKYVCDVTHHDVDQRMRSLVNRVLKAGVEKKKLQLVGARYKIAGTSSETKKT
ncbi:histone H1.2-like [Condylostylus longicornis]|uniref:histone H1.2-like n=1 Tax=Condylostylus longicornis TaxID=2530218 RepID=UPI00244E2F08|nr:histone H1.2-like [Condylostylus longicornis]